MNRIPMNLVRMLLLVPMLATSLALAAELQPYSATYTASMGMLSGTSTEKLSVDPQGSWQLSQDLDAMVASIRETSRFRLHQGRVRPDHYDYKFSALLKRKEQRELFDWKRQQVTHTYKGETSVQTLPAGTLDRISSRLQLRMDVADGGREFSYQVAEKGRIKTYRFAIVGEETLQTPVGKLRTVKLTRVREPDSERETFLWLAPTLDHLLVRLHQKEDDDSELIMELQSTSLRPE